MGLWFTELHPETAGLAFRVRETLFSRRSRHQLVQVFDTDGFGRMLVLDGLVQTTERDEAGYHEMLAHVPLFAHPRPERVLVIGGGDGGTLRECLRHPEVARVVLVEIDPVVIEVSRRFLPGLACSFDDPRAELVIGDGIAHVAQCEAAYDAILVDSSDPIGPSEGLFAEPFYRAARRALRPGGVLALQSGSPFHDGAQLRAVHERLRSVFPRAWAYLSSVPSYPSGLWSFALSPRDEAGPDPLRDLDEGRVGASGTPFRYYSAEVHRASFALPRAVRDLVQGATAPTP